MDHLYLGQSGLRVSRLSLGTMGWGSEVNEEDAQEQFSTFIAAGGTTVETGPHFGQTQAESILSDILADTTPRDEVILSVTSAPVPTDPHGPVDASRQRLLAQLDGSLARLGTDYLDLWSVPLDRGTPVEETLSCLEYAYTSGKARYVGLVPDSAWLVARAAALAPVPLVSVSTEYSLLRRDLERELLDAAAVSGQSLRAWSPLAYGALSGKYAGGKTPARSRAADSRWEAALARYLDETSTNIIEALGVAAQGLNISPVSLALGWLLAKDEVAQVVMGARNNDQLKELLKSANVSVPTEILAVLDEVAKP